MSTYLDQHLPRLHRRCGRLTDVQVFNGTLSILYKDCSHLGRWEKVMTKIKGLFASAFSSPNWKRDYGAKRTPRRSNPELSKYDNVRYG
jgi:hypothetical protein